MGTERADIPTIELYGDEDDHLRLITLAAGRLAHLQPDAANTCRRAENNPWSERLEAFESLVRHIPRGGRALCVRDPDALFVGPIDDRRRWDDTWFAGQRNAVLKLLVDAAAERGSVVFERPYPREGVTRRIVRARPSEATLALLGPFERVGSPFEPPGDLAPVARWLLEQGVLEDDDLRQLVELGRPRNVLVAAWEHLLPSARRDAAALSTVRYAIPVNGAAGPFAWSAAARPSEPSEVRVSRASVDTLVRAGFLREGGHSGRLQMPRPVRKFVAEHARWLDPAVIAGAHRQACRHTWEATSAPEQDERVLEVHWHAVAAGDTATAMDTARFYGADLRFAGYQLGQNAHRARRRRDTLRAIDLYFRARDVFRSVVERFDPADAYAWEYLAFNHWQALRLAAESREDEQVEVERGLERACELEPLNLLFRGRLLSFRASLGRPVDLDDFGRWLRHPAFSTGRGASRWTDPERLTWLVEPLLRELRRRGDETTPSALRERFPEIGAVERAIEQRSSPYPDER